MKITYGIDIQESDDPYNLVSEEAIRGINEAGIPGAFWVDVFPMLKHVPSWFPGAGFQKKAAHWREVNKALTETPFRYVKEQLVGVFFLRERDLELEVWTMNLQQSGNATPSVAASLIQRLPDENDPQRPIEERVAQNVAAVAFTGQWQCKQTPKECPLTLASSSN